MKAPDIALVQESLEKVAAMGEPVAGPFYSQPFPDRPTPPRKVNGDIPQQPQKHPRPLPESRGRPSRVPPSNPPQSPAYEASIQAEGAGNDARERPVGDLPVVCALHARHRDVPRIRPRRDRRPVADRVPRPLRPGP